MTDRLVRPFLFPGPDGANDEASGNKQQVVGAAGSTTRRGFLGNVAKVSAVAAVAVAPVKCGGSPPLHRTVVEAGCRAVQDQ